jgi:hypothetical protein
MDKRGERMKKREKKEWSIRGQEEWMRAHRLGDIAPDILGICAINI